MANIAVMLDSGYEDSEFSVPKDKLEEAGYKLTIVGIEKGKKLSGKNNKSIAKVDVLANSLCSEDFDGLLILGGNSPDHLRIHEPIVSLVRSFNVMKKPIAAICHGPQLLIEADIVNGTRLTSWVSIKTDLQNAGATWLDEPVVVDENIITGRKPEDLDLFCIEFIRQLKNRNLAGFQ